MFKNKRFYIAFALLLLLSVVAYQSCSVNKAAQTSRAKLLQKGKLKEDSSYVYWLPYEHGRSHLMVQGYYSAFTHKNRIALDFKMKKGTRICAARDGIVERLRETGDKGGLKPEYRQYANYVVIRHDDGSRAGYWHLKKDGVLVEVGDRVKKGQVIALSGNTGYTAFPHLHFLVWRNDPGTQWNAIPTRFLTTRKTGYLRPLRRYRSKHQ